MKKLLLSAAVIAATVLSLSGCKNNQTPETDTTKLWPAYDSNAKKFGYIDNKGTFKVPAMYDEASNFFSCGYALVSIGSTEYFIDQKGNMKYTAQKEESLNPFYYNYATIYKDGKYGLMDRSFKYSINPFFSYLGYMSINGLIAAKQTSDGKYGYVDAKGKSKISPMYEYASTFVDGYAVASMDGSKYGIIDKAGKYAIQPTYRSIRTLGNGRWAVKTESDDNYSLIDIKGNMKGVFDNIYSSFDNEPIFIVENSDGKWGVADKDGKLLVSYQYDDLDSFSEGIADAYTEGNDSETMLLIDKKGNVLYSEANAYVYQSMHNGLILVVSYDNKTGKETYKWMDKKGQIAYSWTFGNDYKAPARAPKAKNNEWTPEPFFVLK